MVFKWLRGRCIYVILFLIINMIFKFRIVDLVIFKKWDLKNENNLKCYYINIF